jgi:hypothetical protein
MNYLQIAQLASTAFQIIGKAAHSQFNHDAVTEVKAGLEQLFKFCQQQHNDQEKASQQSEAPDQKALVAAKGE